MADAVTGLEYEAHRELALREALRTVGAEASSRFGAARVAIAHRLGVTGAGRSGRRRRRRGSASRAPLSMRASMRSMNSKSAFRFGRRSVYHDGGAALARKCVPSAVNLDLRKLAHARKVRRSPRSSTSPAALAASRLQSAHGYSSSKHNFDALCGFAASHGFHVISIDFPGHKLGASGGRLESVDDLTDALAAAVRYLRETYAVPVYTMGHSMGAATALRTCAADPVARRCDIDRDGLGAPDRAGRIGGARCRRFAVVVRRWADAARGRRGDRTGARLRIGRAGGTPGAVRRGRARRHGLAIERTRTLPSARPNRRRSRLIASDHTSAGENARADRARMAERAAPR